MSRRGVAALIVGVASAVCALYVFAAAGDITVTESPRLSPAFTKYTIAFTLNGTTSVSEFLDVPYPIVGGSVESTITTPAGTVSAQVYDATGALFDTSTGIQLFQENYSSLRIRGGLFEQVTVGNAQFYLAPSRLGVVFVSTTSSDTGVTGTAVITVRHQ